MTMDSKSSRDWQKKFCHGIITEREFFEGIIYCAKYEDVGMILSILKEDELSRFKILIDNLTLIKSDAEIVRIGNPPIWGIVEIKKFVDAMDDY